MPPVPPCPAEFEPKLRALQETLRSAAPVALGFSGGVDSTFLAAVCGFTIPDETTLMQLDSPFMGTPERAATAQLIETRRTEECAAAASRQQLTDRTRYIAEGIADEAAREPHVFGCTLVRLAFNPLAEDSVTANNPLRCYYCKRAGFTLICNAAKARGIATVFDGSNADDALANDRPGSRALRELGVRSPLAETGWHKDEECACLRAWGIATWNMPAGACLATRVATGERITADKLAAVRACEDALARHGCRRVRARLIHGTIQVEAAPEEFPLLTSETPKRGTGASVTANVPTLLAHDIAQELSAVSGLPVRPSVLPYRRGGATH